jgi:hypothetical protein
MQLVSANSTCVDDAATTGVWAEAKPEFGHRGAMGAHSCTIYNIHTYEASHIIICISAFSFAMMLQVPIFLDIQA